MIKPTVRLGSRASEADQKILKEFLKKIGVPEDGAVLLEIEDGDYGISFVGESVFVMPRISWENIKTFLEAAE